MCVDEGRINEEPVINGVIKARPKEEAKARRRGKNPAQSGPRVKKSLAMFEARRTQR